MYVYTLYFHSIEQNNVLISVFYFRHQRHSISHFRSFSLLHSLPLVVVVVAVVVSHYVHGHRFYFQSSVAKTSRNETDRLIKEEIERRIALNLAHLLKENLWKKGLVC